MSHSIDEKLLIDIFRISSPSRKEFAMRKFIRDFLTVKNISFTEDTDGNIFNLTFKQKPVLSSHMDTVEKYADSPLMKFVDIRKYKDKKFLKGYGVIGGDDKCGIYIMLKLLDEGLRFNFIFSVNEEVGALGIQEVVRKQDFSNVTYGLILDRRNNCDIICLQNEYGTKEFEDDLKTIGKEFGYSPTRGTLSDANYIRKKISCANISVGYYEPHTSKEYVSLEDLSKAYDFCLKTINTLEKKYEAPKITEVKSYNYEYGSNYYNTPYYCNYCYTASKQKCITVSKNKKICLTCLKDIFKATLTKENFSRKEVAEAIFDYKKDIENAAIEEVLTLPSPGEEIEEVENYNNYQQGEFYYGD